MKLTELGFPSCPLLIPQELKGNKREVLPPSVLPTRVGITIRCIIRITTILLMKFQLFEESATPHTVPSVTYRK